MRNKKITILALLLLFTLTGFFGAVNAQNYIPAVTWYGPTPAAPQDDPPYWTEVMDPVYGTYFKKVTDDSVKYVPNKPGGHDRGYYSLRPVFNANSTMYLMRSGRIYKVENNDYVGQLWFIAGDIAYE